MLANQSSKFSALHCTSQCMCVYLCVCVWLWLLHSTRQLVVERFLFCSQLKRRDRSACDSSRAT